MTKIEYVLQETPFIVRRRVKWGDCDPAGVVYTVMFAEYVISAADLFYGRLLGGTPQRIKDSQGFGTPTRALTFDFRASVWPDDDLDVRVTVEDVRDRTYSLCFEGSVQEKVVFESKLTPICVARGERRAISIPDVLRTALLSYRQDCCQGNLTSSPRRKGVQP
ncbi:acyl-CoA thioesterase [Allopusillimonas soli]|uniref:Acyl-CoA thioesterase n=1 Tax=Allopusillimonas soli TaxID=659016 RepID=A0A853FDK3_9BURK|nr:thioesterase family protein [Allopusillimonas soli]NYT38153.1 acyl-CoA thioesterase [Allopusillimonas soli]TEA74026.1 acyl-CoA thioesterase [Allopusillimonas soli]